mmetsp:Transcript_16722/g.42339  ORF Transcript_16722/g.42339 Transcript_16722/m.42339 type:complete len:333 (+) Transcript_16722:163-1161(+)
MSRRMAGISLVVNTSSAPKTLSAASARSGTPSQRSFSGLGAGMNSVNFGSGSECAALILPADGHRSTMNACCVMPVRYRKSASCRYGYGMTPVTYVCAAAGTTTTAPGGSSAASRRRRSASSDALTPGASSPSPSTSGWVLKTGCPAAMPRTPPPPQSRHCRPAAAACCGAAARTRHPGVHVAPAAAAVAAAPRGISAARRRRSMAASSYGRGLNRPALRAVLHRRAPAPPGPVGAPAARRLRRCRAAIGPARRRRWSRGRGACGRKRGRATRTPCTGRDVLACGCASMRLARGGGACAHTVCRPRPASLPATTKTPAALKAPVLLTSGLPR